MDIEHFFFAPQAQLVIHFAHRLAKSASVVFIPPRLPPQPTKTKNPHVDSRPAERGDRRRRQPEDALHPGLRALRHPQGHALRQHPRQVEADGRPGGGRADPDRRTGGPRVLLRRLRLAVQPADEEVAGFRAELRREVAQSSGPRVHVHGALGLQVVVGFLQEAQHRVSVLREQRLDE